MRNLLLVVLVLGVCTPAISAQETANAGIYGGIQNLRFTHLAPGKQVAKQVSAKTGIHGDLQNLDFNVPAPSKQDVNSLPPAMKSTFFSATSNEMEKQYANNLPLNSPVPGGRQCPPSCPRDDFNRFEIYVGYSVLSQDLRLFNFVGDVIGDVNVFNFDLFDNDGLRVRRELNGVDVSFTYNFTRYVGAQFDISAHRRTRGDVRIPFRDFDDNFLVLGNIDETRFRLTHYLVGIQVKDNDENGPRARPFGNFLAGVATQRLRLRNLTFIGDFDRDGDFESLFFSGDGSRFRRNSFALAIGGGIDIRLTDRFSVRVLKFDYLPIFSRRNVLFLDLPTLLDPDFNLFFVDRDDDDRRIQHNFRVGIGAVFHF
jgi:hypothetical protein